MWGFRIICRGNGAYGNFGIASAATVVLVGTYQLPKFEKHQAKILNIDMVPCPVWKRMNYGVCLDEHNECSLLDCWINHCRMLKFSLSLT
jgi:hypothetical protein